MRRLALPALAAVLLAPTPAWSKTFIGTARPDHIVGTNRPDLIRPNGGADTVDARGGDDRIVAPADGYVDAIACGDGADLALVDLADTVAADCETVARQISQDETSGFRAQHETEVEPDSFAFGRTIVTAFQIGRFGAGGAEAIGWATSRDAGGAWRAGALAAGFPAVSDPVVAYDAVHATWLISFLGLSGRSVDVFVSRSPDGVTWGAPVAVAPAEDTDADKEWTVCDNGAASPFRGRCYVSYLDTATGAIVTRSSTDGGVTWSGAVVSSAGVGAGTFVNGALPVVRPNGNLLVLFTVFAAFGDLSGDWVGATRSTDGGATFTAAARVAELDGEDVLGLRAPPLVSADVDSTGAVYAAWSDCRFRTECTAADIVLAVSRDGVHWAPPARVPAVEQDSRVDAFVPALAVSGSKLALAYYTQPQPDGCAVESCRGLDAWLLTSTGGRWGAPLRLSPQPMPLRWLADGGLGAMVGDYVSVSWTGGRPLAAVALATVPSGGFFREAIFAAGGT